jgi:4-hydroxybenzoate polyprenyltransferase
VSEARASAAAHGGWRAWAELLRAPLLLSPVADVLAGWCLGAACFRLPGGDRSRLAGVLEEAARSPSRELAAAAAAGICLLAAGMAQNALADRDDDALRKPGRPLPRGALSPREVAVAWAALTLAGMGLAASVSGAALAVAAAIAGLTAAYHYGLKPLRAAGCLTLGTLRACDLLLGVCVAMAWLVRAEGAPILPGPVMFDTPVALTVAGLYAAFMTGASLHASTDDEAPSRPSRLASLLGTSLNQLALAGLTVVLADMAIVRLLRSPDAGAWAMLLAGLALTAFAILRAWRGARTLPPGPLTGVLLSGLYLFDAAVCAAHPSGRAGLAASAFVLLLFCASRIMRRSFPPT